MLPTLKLWEVADNWIVWAIILLAFFSYIVLLNLIFSPRDVHWHKSTNYWLTAAPVLLSALPLLGLLGTIDGLMQTFREMGNGGIDLESLLSSGIADALVTTQLGLVMVIPGWLLLSLLRFYHQKLDTGNAG